MTVVLFFWQMLEFYEHHKEALQVLNDYAYDSNFPPNPNAHVYLYQYLKRQGASEKRLMKVLKVKLHTKLTVTIYYFSQCFKDVSKNEILK